MLLLSSLPFKMCQSTHIQMHTQKHTCIESSLNLQYMIDMENLWQLLGKTTAIVDKPEVKDLVVQHGRCLCAFVCCVCFNLSYSFCLW